MLYIHIPFCKQKCSYCNFHFSTSLKLKNEMLFAIKNELSLRNNELKNKTLETLYFGGGTPSILEVDEIKMLMDEILKYFDFSRDIEITLEANPDDLDQKFLKGVAEIGINRLSIGIQSFHDEDLRLMNRAHSSSQAESSVKRAQDAGIQNISIDLIYGAPTSNFEIWKQNLDKAIVLEVPHISSYALTIEPRTALENWINKGKISPPKENTQNEEFYYMVDFLKDNGFDHYEISNFGKPDFYSKHNTSYWKYKPYLGIGPSAHSYDGGQIRAWNIANNSLYIKDLLQGKLPIEKEILSEKDRYNEMLMIGLRTSWGVDLAKIKNDFSDEIIQKFNADIQPKIEQGILLIENNHLKIPEKHWFFADGIASDLFLI